LTPLGLLFNGLALAGGGFVYWRFAEPVVDKNIRLAAAMGLLLGALFARLAELVAERAPLVLILHLELGGRTILGGVLGGWIAVELSKRHLGIRTPTGDAFALALAAGEAVGRIGCFFNGCCYGRESSLPWAVFQHGGWRHPTQIYSSLAAGAILVTLLVARTRVAKGQLFAIYLVLFGLARLGLEPLRADVGGGSAALAMTAATALIVGGCLLWRRRATPALSGVPG